MEILNVATIWARVTLVVFLIGVALYCAGYGTMYWMQNEAIDLEFVFSVGLWRAQNCSGGYGAACSGYYVPDMYKNDWLYNISTLPHVFSAVKHRSSAARSKPAMLHKIIPPMAAYDIEALVRLLNEVKKSTNTKGSTPKTQNMNIAGLDAIKNRHRRNSHSSQVSNHLLVHILDQARKGHVTSSMMSHWMERIKDDMADGSISHSEFNEFMRQLSEHTSTDPYSDHCCWFG